MFKRKVQIARAEQFVDNPYTLREWLNIDRCVRRFIVKYPYLRKHMIVGEKYVL